VQAIRAGNLFSSRTVSADTTTTWKSTSSTGATIGTYTIDVQKLATKSHQQGAIDVGAGLNGSSQRLRPHHREPQHRHGGHRGQHHRQRRADRRRAHRSMQDVFDKISIATGDVTGSYNSGSDTINLARPLGAIVLGATNDTSNFLQVMKLANNGTNKPLQFGHARHRQANFAESRPLV